MLRLPKISGSSIVTGECFKMSSYGFVNDENLEVSSYIILTKHRSTQEITQTDLLSMSIAKFKNRCKLIIIVHKLY